MTNRGFLKKMSRVEIEWVMLVKKILELNHPLVQMSSRTYGRNPVTIIVGNVKNLLIYNIDRPLPLDTYECARETWPKKEQRCKEFWKGGVNRWWTHED